MENLERVRLKKIKKKRNNLFSVVPDKMCIFCLYPIPDSQQCVKRGSCRRLILSGLLCLFLFWASGPFVARFEFGPRTLSFSFYLFILSSLWVVLYLVIYFCVYFVFNYYLLLNVMFVFVSFRIVSCFSYLFVSNVVLFI